MPIVHHPEDPLGDRIEARVEDYIHRARRMTLALFGPEAGQHQITVTMQIATAMVQLEAAEKLADAEKALAKQLNREGD